MPKLADAPKSPILITGAHRSGTTWVGKMLAASKEVGYIKEPFNPNHSRGVCTARFQNWFTYITQDNESNYLKSLRDTLSFKYHAFNEIKHARSIGDARRSLGEMRHAYRCRALGVRPLIKDPIAFFSSEWLARTFDIQVVILIRHPAAFASSLKRLDWAYDFSNFARQRCLMNDLLGSYRDAIQMHINDSERSIVEQACLLWNIIYSTVHRFKQSHPDWVIVRHEDLSREPCKYFSTLCDRLAIGDSERVLRLVYSFSKSGNVSEVEPNTVYQIKRDSKANIWNWVNRLDKGEIELIYDRTWPVHRYFYDDSDWRKG